MIATAMRTWDQENRDKRGRQLQLDICGELMDSVCLYDRWYGHIPSAEWVYDHWDQPDDGIWETAAAPRSSCTRTSSAGWRSNGRSGWPHAGACPPTSSAGGRPAMQSTGGSWTAAGHQP